MKNKHILVVEDEEAISDMIGFSLERAGYQWAAAVDVKTASIKVADQRPDLILLDWMLPDVSGVDFAKRLNKDESTSDIPIIMLTARSAEDDKVRGLEAGADDYICKPFSPRELLARIRAVLRRGQNNRAEDEICQIRDLILNPSSHRVTVSDSALEMGPTEFRLLHFLMTHQERVYSRAQLLDRVWGGNVYIEDRTVDVHIRRLRKVLSTHGYDQHVQTVRGAGYRFSAQLV